MPHVKSRVHDDEYPTERNKIIQDILMNSYKGGSKLYLLNVYNYLTLYIFYAQGPTNR